VEFDVSANDLVRAGYVLWEAHLPPGTPQPEVSYRASGVRLDPVSTIVRETLKDGSTRISGVIAGEPEGEALAQTVTIAIGQPVRAFRTSATAGVER
jgi:hypothetical protein